MVVFGVDEFGSLVDDALGCDDFAFEQQGAGVVYGLLVGYEGDSAALVDFFWPLHIIE